MRHNEHGHPQNAIRNGAKFGIIMEAKPKVNDSYRQELAVDAAWDMAQVHSVNESTEVPAGSFKKCLMTKDFSAIIYHKGVNRKITGRLQKGNLDQEVSCFESVTLNVVPTLGALVTSILPPCLRTMA